MWTLASCIDRQGKLPARDAAGWVIRAAAGLAALHGRGEAHGRICADAVCVEEIGCAEVGYLARPGDLADEVAYHSPERVRDGKASLEDDVWALGVVFFQCLTGKLPFPGTTRQQVAVSILKKPIAVLAKEMVEDLALRTALGALLVRDAEKRVRTVQDLRAKLIEVFPDLARLRPLGVGEPLEGAAPAAASTGADAAAEYAADVDDDDDDDGALATALFKDDPWLLQVRVEEAQRRAAATAAGLQSLEEGRGVPVPPAAAPAAIPAPPAAGIPRAAPAPRPAGPAPRAPVAPAAPRIPSAPQAGQEPPPARPPAPAAGTGGHPASPPVPPPRAFAPAPFPVREPAGQGFDASAVPPVPAEIEDAPTVDASSRLRETGSGGEQPPALDRDAPVFNPDAVFGPPTALGPPIAPATADFAAVDGPPAQRPPVREPVDAVSEAVTAPPRRPAPADPAYQAPAFEPPALDAPPFVAPKQEEPAHEEPVYEAEPEPPAEPAPFFAPIADEPLPAPAPAMPAPAPVAAPAARPPAAAQPRAAAPAAAPSSGGSWLRDLLLVLVLIIIGGVVGFVFLGKMWTKATPAPAPSVAPTVAPARSAPAPGPASATSSPVGAPSAPASAPTATPSATPSDAPSAAPTATATAAADAAGETQPGGNVTACLASTFAAGTFQSSPPNLDFVCAETDAYKGGVDIRVKVIRAGGGSNGVTEGMREWSMLGWYEMAAFVVVRGLCCENPPALKTQPGIDMCPLDEKLEALSKAVVNADDRGVEEALKEFAGVLRCLVAAGVSRTFGQPGAPDPGAVTVFRKTLERVRKAAGH